MNRGRICPALLLIGATCTGVVTAQAKAGYEIAVVQDVMIPMRDGTRLAADICRPAQNIRRTSCCR